MTSRYKQAFTLIKQAKNILLVTHHNPDGDAISSVCAMSEYLKLSVKKHVLYCHNEPPAKFDFLSCADEFVFKINDDKTSNESYDFDFFSFDLIIVFDCGSLSRTSLDHEIKRRQPGQKIIEFDHHPKVDDYADVEIRDPRSASTSELIYDFFKTNNIRPNKNMAQAILTGISTDTGNFLFPSTTENTIKISSEMMLYGANLPKIVSHTYRDKSLKAMKLWGKVMSNLKINKRYGLAITVLTFHDMEQEDINEEEMEGISNFLSNLGKVKAILFLREKHDGVIKGSLRTADPQIDISILAKLLGGGGHAKASGFSLDGRLIETEHGWKVI